MSALSTPRLVQNAMYYQYSFCLSFHANPSPCITSQTPFCYAQVEPILKTLRVSFCYCMQAITDGQGCIQYVICVRGTKMEIKRKERRIKYT